MQDMNLNSELPSLSPEEAELERALGGLRPAAPALDRDALMFAAGRASVRTHAAWPWQCATAAMVVLVGAFALMGPQGFREGRKAPIAEARSDLHEATPAEQMPIAQRGETRWTAGTSVARLEGIDTVALWQRHAFGANGETQ
jgi:hypothetical protein